MSRWVKNHLFMGKSPYITKISITKYFANYRSLLFHVKREARVEICISTKCKGFGFIVNITHMNIIYIFLHLTCVTNFLYIAREWGKKGKYTKIIPVKRARRNDNKTRYAHGNETTIKKTKVKQRVLWLHFLRASSYTRILHVTFKV